MTVTPPIRTHITTTPQAGSAARLRRAIQKSDRVKKDYAVSRGKQLMHFVRDSAKHDLIVLEASALTLAEKFGFDADAYAEDLEKKIGEVSDEGSGSDTPRSL